MGTVTDDPRLRERRFVFSDRHDAGRQLGELIRSMPPSKDPVVLAIPAGGVPIGAEIARAIHAKFGLAIVRKIQVPGNTEAGFGAVTWDGQVLINDILRSALGLTESQVASAIERTRQNVAERTARFSAGFPLPDIAGRQVFIADDGLASGFTMLAAVASIGKLHPDRITVAVPTASASVAETVARQVDRLVCLNIRSAPRFAVAEAYKRWHDLDDNEVIAELGFFRPGKREVH
ncbi:MAG TPA: phosphoribosyltransferase family protein [Methanoregula sp.]|nr:phosphoribosyltransferase family protein [Methanoregula sp.]